MAGDKILGDASQSDDQLKLQQILKRFDRDFEASYDARREAVNDLFFSRVSQWDDWLENFVTLQYRGQFDIVRPVVRKLVAEMRQNPVQVRYRPKDGANPDAADILQGMYRTDVRNNDSTSAINVAVREQLEAGYGAWRYITEWDDEDPLSNKQRIRRVPIHEAADHVIWDSNSKRIDKSDARHVTIITGFTEDAWEDYAEEEGFDVDFPSFRNPDTNYQFPWVSSDKVFVGEYYEKVVKKERCFVFESPVSPEPVAYWQSEVKGVMEQLSKQGYVKVAEKRIPRTHIWKYLVTGTQILKKQRIAGSHLPVVPVYGEWGFAADKEVYEGVVRLMKDAQRARNTVMSFNMDIVSKSPRKKPIFYPEQIVGLEDMYDSEDDYPYYLINRTDDKGNPLPGEPIGYMANAEIPQANAQMLQDATQAIRDVSALGVGAQQVAGQQVAFETVNQINQRADLESYIFMDNLATAMRRDGEIYQSLVAEVYDVPRQVVLTDEDGTEREVMILEEVMDYSTFETRVLNDIRGKFETFVDVGPSYQSQKDAMRAQLIELIGQLPPDAADIAKILLLQYLAMQDGKVAEFVRKYANRQLVIMGVKEPEDQEQAAALQQAQQQAAQQQDPNMVLAQAEMVKGQASLVSAQSKAQSQQADTQVKAFQAQTDYQKAQAQIIETLVRAKNLDEKSVREAIDLVSRVQKQSNEQTNEQLDRWMSQVTQQQSAPAGMPQQQQPLMSLDNPTA